MIKNRYHEIDAINSNSIIPKKRLINIMLFFY